MRLELTEDWSLAMPDTPALRGVAVRTPTEAIGWGRGRGVVLIPAGDEARRIGEAAVGSPIAAAFPEDAWPLEVIDSEGPALVRLGRDGRVLSRTPLSLPERPAAGWRGPDGWRIGSWRVRGQYCVDRLDSRGMRADSVCLPTDLFPDAGVFLSGVDGKLVVSRLSAPFTFVVVEGRDVVLRARPPASVQDRAQEAPLRYASAPAGVLPLGDGYLQSLVDRASVRRLWLLYDSRGNFVRERVIDAPLTPLRASPEDGQLLVARRGRLLSVVNYHYRWSEQP